MWLITHGVGISKLERATGNLQPIETGDLDIGFYINTCPDGHVLFIAIPKGEGESRLFRMEADGTGITQLTTTGIARTPFCTLDSQKVYFTIRPKTNVPEVSLWSIPLAGGPPQKELDAPAFGSLVFSRDAKLAISLFNVNLKYYMQLWDISTRQMVKQLPWNVSNLTGGLPPVFAPDGKAIVLSVSSQGSTALQYEPVDGSPPHLISEPTHEIQTAVAWSPSGSKMGVLQLRRSSDVVLITDLVNQQAH